ncbi:hypothetical protein K443DRAFT_13976 [Laccaria amethystina LaAM-08-1]|uniref:Uncharacterized protein n=1 Tax=Laccaria amethystina LaAM-08-1 TaxID=1095629 RepID=A0A0C9X2T6_9AGAR|nr:hypothetical protein K443DRAFT_13976 [Laccaria amethystina LaAM-08-1]
MFQHQQLLLSHENERIRTCCMQIKRQTMTGSSSDVGFDSLSIPRIDVSALCRRPSRDALASTTSLERQEGTHLNAWHGLRGRGNANKTTGSAHIPFPHI